MGMKDISLVIHGDGSRHWLKQIFKDIKRANIKFKEIVIVSYKHDMQLYNHFLQSNKLDCEIKLVPCLDLLNPGFYNINRQINSIKIGLTNVSHNSYVIKLRNDQSVNFVSVISHLNKLKTSMILSTNCFTRLDRLYHPSDMLLAGKKNDLVKYFSCPLMTNTHLGHILQNQKEFEASNYTLKALECTPESYLFKNYIKLNGWHEKRTQEDSLLSMRKFIYLVNSWDIGYRWKESRTPFLPKGSLILPYYFDMAPFENGPVEKCRCLNKHEFMNKTSSIKDIYFILLSKLVYGLKFNIKLKKNRYKLKYKFLKAVKCFIYIFPYMIVSKGVLKLDKRIEKSKKKYKMYKNLIK
ncbi:WavE lipopolysaccharide synthesis family protein [Snodgrassella gandavensis]|uniref:WavE lipopolysaccharide synthesis family protein n=1 Tax=Snodgrassella gandavensis TaxID=2946698 RepID=UPI001EF518AE|nr:WavE lipopolysaccharide synthesis family protein [Snodgrassella gandavensis]